MTPRPNKLRKNYFLNIFRRFFTCKFSWTLLHSDKECQVETGRVMNEGGIRMENVATIMRNITIRITTQKRRPTTRLHAE